MAGFDAESFAKHWIAAWSARDVDTVLGHFADSVEFTSPKALAIVGQATLQGKEALAAYWRQGLKAIESIRFTLDYVVHDAAARRLAIVYTAEFNGRRTRATEFMTFDAHGKVVRGEAMYGVPLP